jgi:hypothetical protein
VVILSIACRESQLVQPHDLRGLDAGGTLEEDIADEAPHRGISAPDAIHHA